MLERVHLDILQQVQICGSLTAASRAMHLTQSALSHAIKKLEQQLGCALWQRDGRRLRLTQAGEYLLELAERVLPQLQLAESHLKQMADGRRGQLRIGMECHPCYQWLLKVASPYLQAWPGVDVDVKQQFQFDGITALQDFAIDLLVTPDPIMRKGLHFEPVFDYEQVLVMPRHHALAQQAWVQAADLADEALISYPVALERLDIYTRFLIPASIRPRKHKTIENTDIMLQMVASGRGVTALPHWLVLENPLASELATARLGPNGMPKQIHLGMRQRDADSPYLQGFMALATATA